MNEMTNQYGNSILILIVAVMCILILMYLSNQIGASALNSVLHYTSQEQSSTLTTTW